MILEKLAPVGETLRNLGMRRLALFGSAARGESAEGSDLDFLSELGTKTYDAYMDVKELLEGVVDRPVDLVLVDAVNPDLRDAILSEAVDVPGY